ncbi:hypothetical protein COY27_02755 [Candidatus Woesearchaeota archaeon CG_4_10_14_0_2_um_filter_33_13]|nr:MAG: hypothetical protein COY27_02755 [Candidatus Woesearchaeota archaeon CG_4_10_14_0_2_um_filter_33_13]
MQQLNDEQRKELEEKIKKMTPEELKEFQKQQCVFCQIISNKIPSKKVYEDDKALAILDINPATKGHILILPKEHYSIMPQIPDKEMGHLFSVAKKISQTVLKVLKVSGTNLFIANGLAAGQRAQHFMLHVIPRKEGDKILEIEDRMIEKDIRQKVRSLVEDQFNKLMGIKKTIVNVKEENLETEKWQSKEKEQKQAKTIEENQTPEIIAKETIVQKKKSTEKVKSKEDKKASEKKVIKEKKDVSLDDIADLFK